MTPTLQTSHFELYGCFDNICGDMYIGVPMTVLVSCLDEESALAKPKSVTLRLSPWITIFSGFKSLYLVQSTCAWCPFRTWAERPCRCSSGNVGHHFRKRSYAGWWAWSCTQYISEASVLAKLHDDVVVVGCLDDVDDPNDVLVL